MQLEVTHRTHYAYTSPVSLAHHLACLQPLADPHQQRLRFSLEVSPQADSRSEAKDAHGNTCHWFSLWQAHRELTVTSLSRVLVAHRFADLVAESAPPWDTLAQSLRYTARAAFDAAVQYTVPSHFVPRLDTLRDYAAPFMRPGRPVASAAMDLMQHLHDDFEYSSASTQIDTPLAQAFEQRRGVCQDFAHLMASALRMFGVPVRYVSGYLLTHAPDDNQPMLGADASHAWVQVYCPGTVGVPADGWLDLDPTNNLVPGLGHVRVATGRDFGDVTPLRGVIRGGGEHQLTVGVSTRLVTNFIQ